MNLMNKIIENINWLNSFNDYNEEATKLYLIYPFLYFLGYDIYSPAEVRYEYKCDMYGTRRADCVVLDDDGNPLIIVEAKKKDKDLKDDLRQVKAYFSAVDAEYAFLTDGNCYFVFDKTQKIHNFCSDEVKPIYEFRIEKLEGNDDIIKKFAKINLKGVSSGFSNNIEIKTVEKDAQRKVFKNNIKESNDEDVIENFIDEYQNIDEYSVKSIYTQYEVFAKNLNVEPLGMSKLVKMICEKLSLKQVYRNGVNYFTSDGGLKTIMLFMADYGYERLHDSDCKEIHRKYEDYCNKRSLCFAKQKAFIEHIAKDDNEFEDIVIVEKNVNGVPVKYFQDKSKIEEFTSNVGKANTLLEKVSISKDEGVNKFCDSINVEDIIGEFNADVYKKYEEFCDLYGFTPISNIDFGRKINKFFGTKTEPIRCSGEKKRVFVKNKRFF